MKVKTSDLIGTALDYAVAIAQGILAKEMYYEEGNLNGRYRAGPGLLFSTKWESGGPIIDQEKIGIDTWQRCYITGNVWAASFSYPIVHPTDPKRSPSYHRMRGPTPLIAAMRCYVVSKLGDVVEVPDILFNKT